MEPVARSVGTVLPGFAAWLALAGIAAGVGAFVVIANEVSAGATRTFDRGVLLAFRRPADGSPIGPPALQATAQDVTALGSDMVLGLITTFAAGFLMLDGRRPIALFLVGSVLIGSALTHLLKDVFHRPRPDLVPYAAHFSGASFPSGHSMMSAVTYLTLGALMARSEPRKALKVYYLLFAALLTLIIGVSRVYLGVHWPTDVLAGWIGGSVWALLCWLLAPKGS